jgi:FixJ family two-component response regulator
MVSAKQQTVVIVDDEESVCHSVTRLLKGMHVQVASFGSAGACLKELSVHPCHLLIADINMPDMEGVKFLKQVRAMMPWLPVMIVTGSGNVPLAVESIKMGASDFVEKPLDRETFRASAKTLLDKSKTAQERLGQILTRAEMRIVPLLLAGQSSREIAAQLFRSVRTIELHRQHIMRKMGVHNIVGLIQRINAMGLDITELPKAVDF